jgi:hypothetical protein
LFHSKQMLLPLAGQAAKNARPPFEVNAGF